MPQMRVFLSSTAYDLAMVRGQLGSFIGGLGHQVVMSEYSGVLYDPRIHTHKACVQELATCDAVVMIIGSRWGSAAMPEFVEELAADALDDTSGILKDALADRRVSVTQLEALTAFERGIPMFVFVDRAVRTEARFFDMNQELAFEGKLKLPIMGDHAVAKYVFDFLRYIDARSSGNAVTEFDSIEGIQRHLKGQWSAWLQRLLAEVRETQAQQSLVDAIGEKLEDLKVAMVSTLPDADARNVAAGVLEFRLLCDVLGSLDFDGKQVLISSNPADFSSVMTELGVVTVAPIDGQKRVLGGRTAVVLRDRVVELRMSLDRFLRLQSDWGEFRQLSEADRRVIVETLRRDRRPMGQILRVRPINTGDARRLVEGPPLTADEWDQLLDRVEPEVSPKS